MNLFTEDEVAFVMILAIAKDRATRDPSDSGWRRVEYYAHKALKCPSNHEFDHLHKDVIHQQLIRAYFAAAGICFVCGQMGPDCTCSRDREHD